MRRGNASSFYHFDALGSADRLTGADQAVTDAYLYRAFGLDTVLSGSTVNPYRFVAALGYYKTAASLLHLGARYYMPVIGRFIRRDPARSDLTLYSYGRQNPANYVDPSGEFAWWWLCAIPCGANVGALAAAALGCIGAPDWDACMHDVLSDPDIKCKYRDIAGGACLACLSAGLSDLIGRKPGKPRGEDCTLIEGWKTEPELLWNCLYGCPSGAQYLRHYYHMCPWSIHVEPE
jgi:RHS repeat-associated protein